MDELGSKLQLAKDSIDALKAKEEELMYKQNMAPYLSASNDINALPSTYDILKSIFGQQSSAILNQYDHGGVHLPVAESDATNVQQPQFNIPIAEEEQYVDQFGSSASLYPSDPAPTLWEKIKNAGANPLATFGYSARGEDIPWGNVPRHSNPFDTFALGMINPFAWGESAEASKGALKQGDYLGAGLEALGAVPTIPASIGASRKLLPKFVKTTGNPINPPKAKNLHPATIEKPPTPTSAGNINQYKHKEIQDVIQKRKDYLLSDEYLTKRAANTGESSNQIKAHIDAYLKELDNTTMAMYKEGDLGKNIKGNYGVQGIKINKDMSYKEILETVDHELNHLLSPVQKSGIGNPHANILWKDLETGKRLTEAESKVFQGHLDFDINPKYIAWEKKHANLYKDYPSIKMDVPGDENFSKYLNEPYEQQVRMVRYGEILKKHGWDGTKKGLTNEIIDKANTVGGKVSLPSDVQQLLRNMKGIDAGSPEWYAQIKKTLPHAWALAPVAATQLKE